jgi:hypothetical protein
MGARARSRVVGRTSRRRCTSRSPVPGWPEPVWRTFPIPAAGRPPHCGQRAAGQDAVEDPRRDRQPIENGNHDAASRVEAARSAKGSRMVEEDQPRNLELPRDGLTHARRRGRPKTQHAPLDLEPPALRRPGSVGVSLSQPPTSPGRRLRRVERRTPHRVLPRRSWAFAYLRLVVILAGVQVVRGLRRSEQDVALGIHRGHRDLPVRHMPKRINREGVAVGRAVQHQHRETRTRLPVPPVVHREVARARASLGDPGTFAWSHQWDHLLARRDVGHRVKRACARGPVVALWACRSLCDHRLYGT